MILINGGFYGRVDGQGRLHTNADQKSIILNTRILWAFSASYREFGNQDYKAIASRAFDYLKRYFIDKEFGGVYWMLASDGTCVGK